MKAFYTKLVDGYAQISQSLEIPRKNIVFPIESVPDDYATLVTKVKNEGEDVTLKLSLNKVLASDLNTNKEEYDDMILYLQDNKVTEMKTLIDRYVVIVEYALTSMDMTETYDQGVSVEYPKVEDFIYPLGVNEEDELVYRQLKRLTLDLHFLNKTKLSIGAIKKIKKDFLFIINGITVYQMVQGKENETEEIYHANIHPSMVDNVFHQTPTTILSIINNCEKVYSTEDENVKIASTYMDRLPSRFTLNMTIGLNDLIVGYDDSYVTTVLEENAKPEEPIIPDIEDPENGSEEPVDPSGSEEETRDESEIPPVSEELTNF